ncbi:MAG: zinc ribbon domain-containing protein [Desulfurococcus sp.]|uniref:zinc ribbon domain-containing protein n=2 Tax=Desulfurococcus sp. TaxID=51678 RepID=UPI003162FAFD
MKQQAEKHGVPVVVVEPEGTSTTCPKCNSKMVSNGYRRVKYPTCGFEGNRDAIAVLNIERRALEKMRVSDRPDCPQMTDVAPNRCGEPVNRPRETLALLGLGGGQS